MTKGFLIVICIIIAIALIVFPLIVYLLKNFKDNEVQNDEQKKDPCHLFLNNFLKHYGYNKSILNKELFFFYFSEFFLWYKTGDNIIDFNKYC